jgi:hypothetical protein
MELVARAGKATQSHGFESVMRLQMGKAHLDLLPLIAPFSSLGPSGSANSTRSLAIAAGLNKILPRRRHLPRRNLLCVGLFLEKPGPSPPHRVRNGLRRAGGACCGSPGVARNGDFRTEPRMRFNARKIVGMDRLRPAQTATDERNRLRRPSIRPVSATSASRRAQSSCACYGITPAALKVSREAGRAR